MARDLLYTGAENKLPQRQEPVMGTLVILVVISQGIKSSSGEILWLHFPQQLQSSTICSHLYSLL